MAVSTGWMGKLKKLLSRKNEEMASKVEVQCDVGFGNALYIRGSGAGLNWERGIALKNTASDLWTWETDCAFDSCEFKLLLNDVQYETGENHFLVFGNTVRYTPRF
jgi:hypothetical protein